MKFQGTNSHKKVILKGFKEKRVYKTGCTMTLVEFLGIFDYFSKAEALRNHQACPPKNGRNEEKFAC